MINAGGIINVAMEYLGHGDEAQVRARIEQIPGRLETIWDESEATGRNAADVADAMAQKLIGRASFLSPSPPGRGQGEGLAKRSFARCLRQRSPSPNFV